MTLLRRLLPLALLLPMAAAAAETGALQIERPWARATAGNVMAGAAYFTVVNAGSEPDRLVGADTPVAENAGLHTHVLDGATMRMRPVGAIAIPAGGRVELHPGGLHVMLTGMKAPLRKGGDFPLTLKFEKAGSVTVQVPILAINADGPETTSGTDGVPMGDADHQTGKVHEMPSDMPMHH